MRDDILRALQRGEVTIALWADYSKSFDTVAYETVLRKKPTHLKDGEKRLQQALNESATWLADCNLCLNLTKTKVVLFSTKQLSSFHGLSTFDLLTWDLGWWLETGKIKNLEATWHENIWNGTVKLTQKCRKFAPFNVREQLAESLVLSKLYYNDTLFITTFLITWFAAYSVSRLQPPALLLIVMRPFLRCPWLERTTRSLLHKAQLVQNGIQSDWPP